MRHDTLIISFFKYSRNIAHCFLIPILSEKVQSYWILFFLYVMYLFFVRLFFGCFYNCLSIFDFSSILVIYDLPCSKSFQNLPVKMTQIYYHTVSMDQEPRIWAQLSKSLSLRRYTSVFSGLTVRNLNILHSCDSCHHSVPYELVARCLAFS